jgi:hypothetical protein
MKWTLRGGGSAEVVGFDGERVTLIAGDAAPPGSTIEATADSVSRPFRVKVRSCRRQTGDQAEARFRVEGRLIDATREQRAALSALPGR